MAAIVGRENSTKSLSFSVPAFRFFPALVVGVALLVLTLAAGSRLDDPRAKVGDIADWVSESRLESLAGGGGC